MGLVRPPQPVKLFSGFIYKQQRCFEKAKTALIKNFGKCEFESGRLDFNYTDYYRREFGAPLFRKFISFRKPVDPHALYQVKLITGAIEEELSIRGKRTVNIDPGYISLSKLVLATTKDFAHRIYLDGGIYAEVTLLWRDNTFKPLDWTYPDYRTKEYIAIFNRIRNDYADGTKDPAGIRRSL